tara:strand:+ start:192 stop:449 length:258 start_codon:yes stop_codon:yes gene_type:complete
MGLPIEGAFQHTSGAGEQHQNRRKQNTPKPDGWCDNRRLIGTVTARPNGQGGLMSKSQDSKREKKKEPLKTPQEKKQAKRDKKNA